MVLAVFGLSVTATGGGLTQSKAAGSGGPQSRPAKARRSGFRVAQSHLRRAAGPRHGEAVAERDSPGSQRGAWTAISPASRAMPAGGSMRTAGVHGFGVDRQLPPEVVRSPAPQPAEGPGGSRGVYRARCTGRSWTIRRAWSVLAMAAEKLDLGKRKPRGVHRRPLAPGGVGGGQAGAHRGPGRLRRGAGAAEQRRDPGAADVPLSGHGGPEPRGPHAQRPRHRPPPLRLDGEDGPRRDDRRGRSLGADHRSQAAGATQAIARRRRRDVPGVTGRVAAKIDTPAGAIVIGGKGTTPTISTTCPAWPR